MSLLYSNRKQQHFRINLGGKNHGRNAGQEMEETHAWRLKMPL